MHPALENLLPMPRLVRPTGKNPILLCRNSVPAFHIDAGSSTSPVFAHTRELLKNALTEKGCLAPMNGAYPIRLNVDPDCPALAGHAMSDAYAIRITAGFAELTGYDAGGALYAVHTFLQLLSAEGGCLSVPEAEIVDWPSFPTRSLFIENRYGSDFLTFENWKQAIDYFSGMKLNELTVGVYGCWCQQFDGMISEYLYIPFKKYPQLRTPRHVKYYSVEQRKWIWRKNVLPVMFEENYLGDLIAYAKTRNIKIRPLFNSYGHNTLIPRLFPELSAKDESGSPTGFGVCTADERTYEIMFGLYDEIIDRYLAPNGIDTIHIGLDEVWEGIGMDADNPFRFHTPFCRCEKCRGKERSELMVEYIIRICRHLKAKGMHGVYIYQDMLQHEFDILDETLAQRLKDADVYDVVVIDWWNYAHESKIFKGKPLNDCFRSVVKPFTGYYHWSLPMEYLSNIRGCARLAKQYGFEGLDAYSSLEYCHDRSYRYLAELAWNIDTLEDQSGFLRRYAERLFPGTDGQAEAALEAMADMTDALRQDSQIGANDLFGQDYYMYTYVRADEPYPRRFPDGVFRSMKADEECWRNALHRINRQAADAADFFAAQVKAGSGDPFFARAWHAVALHYQTITDEYLGLLDLEKEQDASVAIKMLQKLCNARENLMRTAEQVRIPANAATYLRIQSVYRQILIDLLAYAEKRLADGKPFDLCLRDISVLTGETLRALR